MTNPGPTSDRASDAERLEVLEAASVCGTVDGLRHKFQTGGLAPFNRSMLLTRIDGMLNRACTSRVAIDTPDGKIYLSLEATAAQLRRLDPGSK